MLAFPIITQDGEANWQGADTCGQQLSTQQQHWLFDDSSLTAKLKNLSEHFAVELLGQRQAPISDDEIAWLSNAETVTVREVILHCDHQPWVFARSVFPQQALQAAQLKLADLGNRPLGEHLFSQADLQRSSIEVSAF